MTVHTNSTFPAEPILRLNPDGHFASIRRIDLDAQGRWLVSGAFDKTVKVWRRADGSLERTVRVPQGDGDLGKVYAVAISPDGAQVAVGGWTGSTDGLSNTIYMFDRATGALQHRIDGLPNAILHLAYAPDGQRLAATLGGANGLRLYSTSDYQEIGRSADYGKASYWADFDADGRLVTSCYDGKVRLYLPDGRLAQAAKAPGGERPYGVAFAPDGGRIAVGYRDTTRVDILHGGNLALRYSANMAGADNGDLANIAWSADGQTLVAGGTYDDKGWTPIRRWSDGGRGPYDELRVTTYSVMTLRLLKDGCLAVGANNMVAVLSPSGKIAWVRSNAIADFRGQLHDKGIRISQTGDTVAFGYAPWGKRPAVFSRREGALTLGPQDLRRLTLPDEGPREGLRVTDWEDTYQPKLNDQPLALKEFERSRSFAICPGGQRFVLGADYSLRAFAPKQEGVREVTEEIWQQPVPGSVWALNISADGRYAVAGYGDGTLRWHRMADGEEVLAFYPHPDGKRWVLWTPQGYYRASAGGEDLIGWHLNRGADRAPDFFPVSRFRERFYRPDVIARVLETADPGEALRLADQARGRATQTKTVAELLPPTISILSPAPGTTLDSQRLVLLYKAESADSPVANIEARHDGRPAVVVDHQQPTVSDDGRSIVGQTTVAIPPHDGVVELIAHNAHGAGEPAPFVVNWAGAEDFYKPSLYVLAVGVSAYPSKALKLRFAARDAEALADVLEAQEGGLYKAVKRRLLVDGDATRDAIREDLNWLRREVSQRDVALVFLAGHGINEDGGYYYLSVDADPLDAMFTALGDDDIRKFLGKIAGKTVLMLDTCYSGSLTPGTRGGDALPDIDKFANELADAENGIVVYSSSTGKEKSLEDAQWGHGAFSYALLEAVCDGKADFTGNGHVTIDELAVYLDDCVKRITNGRQHPTVTKPQAVRNYAMFRVPTGH